MASRHSLLQKGTDIVTKMRRKADLLDGSTFPPLDPLIHNYHASTSDLNIFTLTNNQLLKIYRKTKR